MIDLEVDAALVPDAALRAEILRSRALVCIHLAQNPHPNPNVFACKGLEHMHKVSPYLHRALSSVAAARAQQIAE